MKPICVPCQTFFRPAKNGFEFIETFSSGGEAKPYKLWQGDKWRCPGCGAEIVVGVGASPIAEHYQPDFAAKVEARGDLLKVA